LQQKLHDVASSYETKKLTIEFGEGFGVKIEGWFEVRGGHE
jgi:hypothetical protein